MTKVEKIIEKEKEEAIKAAMSEGMKEGMSQGEKVKAVEIAKNLLDVLSEEMIAKKTGLSIEEVKKLKEEMNGK